MARDHAVVVGASMAGLLAARVLSEHYDRVTVLDRDALPAGLEGRRGVPQGRHAHALLPAGAAHLEQLLPGLSAQLVKAGAPTCTALEQLRWIVNGHELARADTGLQVILSGRPFIEGHVRRRVRALANVGLVDGCEALGLVRGKRERRVSGVLVRGDTTIEADLVVCAGGRSAQVPAWLAALGFPQPQEERLAVNLMYASRLFRLRPGALGGDRMVLVGARPGLPRALALFAQEDDRWIASISGYGPAHRPSRDAGGFAPFLATVAPEDVTRAIRDAEPLTGVATHGFAAGRRWRYDRIDRFPEGLLAIGDAVCSFNPLYGQGITVAAAQALALKRCMADDGRDLARRFFAAARPPADDAWRLATGADLALPPVRAPYPPAVRAVNAYLRRMHSVGADDAAAAAAFGRVVMMVERPPTLFQPRLAVRVLRGARRSTDAAPPAAVRRSALAVGGAVTSLLQAGPPDDREAVVFLHGNPGPSTDWEPLVAAAGVRGMRAVAWDAPGFGGAVTPSGFVQSVDAHAEFIGEALAALGIDRVHLVAHDFGGPWGLRWAAGHPQQFASAVLIGTGALPGYSWHALARVWRTPLLGELFMATTTRAGFGLLLRRGQRKPLPRALVDRMYDGFGRATRRAVLDLYRSIPDVGAAGTELARALAPLDRPALVLWGAHDPYLAVEHAERQREAFPHAEVQVLDDAGHWPFVDEPDLVRRAALEFLDRRFEHRRQGILAA